MPDQTKSSATDSIKLQAYLAHAGIASRRQAEVLIDQKQVTVNGKVASIGQRIIPGKDVIKYRNKVVELKEPSIYILINKPLDLVSTTSDELGRPTVLSILPPELREHRLYPVGRLDQDSQGLLLLTNDGDLAYRLTHPKFKVPKTYLVKLDREPTYKALETIKHGVKLKEGKTAPPKVVSADGVEYENLIDDDLDQWFTITIHEGRNRQVRRMWERVGYDVVSLTRISMGALNLGQLNDQEYLVLTPEQVTTFKKSLGI